MSPKELFDINQWRARLYANMMKRKLKALPRVTIDELYAASLEGVWKASVSWKDGGGMSFNSYATMCANRCMIDWLRKQYKLRDRKVTFISLSNHIKPSGDNTFEHDNNYYEIDNRKHFTCIVDDTDELETALSKKVNTIKLLLHEYFVCGRTVKEIAKKTGINLSYVQLRLRPYMKRAGLGYNKKTPVK